MKNVKIGNIQAYVGMFTAIATLGLSAALLLK
jgi:hypothetical protein